MFIVRALIVMLHANFEVILYGVSNVVCYTMDRAGASRENFREEFEQKAFQQSISAFTLYLVL